MSDFRSVAREWYELFEGGTRRLPDGKTEPFRTIKYEVPDDHPLRACILACHDDGEIPPDDWIYDKVEDWLEAFVDNGAYAEGPEPDVYTNDLLNWLAKHFIAFVNDCDEARVEFGIPNNTDMISRITSGQAYRLSNMGAIIREAIQEEVERREGE